MDVVYYRLENGRCPFEDWVDKLERRSQIAVYDYIDRVACGGSRKNVKSLGDGVWEIKINYKHGTMRVYFGKVNGLIVLLGGSKRDQSADIERAKDYWRSYDEQEQITQ